MRNIYLDRYAYPVPSISDPPRAGTRMIVVIPCYNEPEVTISLGSLDRCIAPGCEVEIIVVVNHGEHDEDSIKSFNISTALIIEFWAKDHPKYPCHVIRAFDLDHKKAGVGLARKIGMDEAVRRFEALGEKNGIIVCFDADCLCSENYLWEIYNCYRLNPGTNVALVCFEHFIDNNTSTELISAITNYELHLRYYVRALAMAKYPFAYHTIGSCITVTSEAYQKHGGMNQRKAGEDFYFLHKIFPSGNIMNITKATVFPSPRLSERVPFGTGKAMMQIIKKPADVYFTYNPEIFKAFKTFNDSVNQIWETTDIDSVVEVLPESMLQFLRQIDFSNQVDKIKQNNTNILQFRRAFYGWFNGFAVLKYMHFSRDNFYLNVEIAQAVGWILEMYFPNPPSNKNQMLSLMREIDRSGQ